MRNLARMVDTSDADKLTYCGDPCWRGDARSGATKIDFFLGNRAAQLICRTFDVLYDKPYNGGHAALRIGVCLQPFNAKGWRWTTPSAFNFDGCETWSKDDCELIALNVWEYHDAEFYTSLNEGDINSANEIWSRAAEMYLGYITENHAKIKGWGRGKAPTFEWKSLLAAGFTPKCRTDQI